YCASKNPMLLVTAETASSDFMDQLAHLKSTVDSANSPHLQKFLKLVDWIVGTFSGIFESISNGDTASGINVLEDANDAIAQVRNASAAISEEQLQRQQYLNAKHTTDEQNLRMLLGLGAVANLVIAVAFGLGFSLTLGRRFRHVHTNALN